MEPKNKQMAHPHEKFDDIIFDVDTVASATECTGLIPTPPISEEAADSYTELYTIPKPVQEKNNGLQKYKKQ